MTKQSFKENETECFGRIFTGERKIVEASYVEALEIAKQKKSYTIEETLIMPCVLEMADIMLGKDAERKVATVSLSNSTIQGRIKDLSYDIKCQVKEEIKTAPFGLFAIRIDKSTVHGVCKIYLQRRIQGRISFLLTFRNKNNSSRYFCRRFQLFLSPRIWNRKILLVVAQIVLQQCWDTTLVFKLQ